MALDSLFRAAFVTVNGRGEGSRLQGSPPSNPRSMGPGRLLIHIWFVTLRPLGQCFLVTIALLIAGLSLFLLSARFGGSLALALAGLAAFVAIGPVMLYGGVSMLLRRRDLRRAGPHDKPG